MRESSATPSGTWTIGLDAQAGRARMCQRPSTPPAAAAHSAELTQDHAIQRPETPMPSTPLLLQLLRELMARRTAPREPEPDLVMADKDQVRAYSAAGRIDGVMAAAYLFHTARISQVIAGRRHVIDLGCGPATQLAQVAQLHPDIRFTGVDLSHAMLEDALRHVRDLRLSNVSFVQGDISELEGIKGGSADAVISTMALHHLPTLSRLESCFDQIRRVLRPDGALYLADFGRPKLRGTAKFFAHMNAANQPPLFSLDYENSINAAFLLQDFKRLANNRLPQGVEVFSTFGVPLLVLTKTADRPLPDAVHARLRELLRTLSPRHRADLRDLQMFFRLGGLRGARLP